MLKNTPIGNSAIWAHCLRSEVYILGSKVHLRRNTLVMDKAKRLLKNFALAMLHSLFCISEQKVKLKRKRKVPNALQEGHMAEKGRILQPCLIKCVVKTNVLLLQMQCSAKLPVQASLRFNK